MRNFIIGMTKVGIISGRIQWVFFPVATIVTSQTNPGENGGNPRLILAPRGVEFDYSLSLFSTQYYCTTHLFLNFTTQREAAIWAKSIQKMLYVVEPTCTLYQLLQNI